jgi:hypothetical protein
MGFQVVIPELSRGFDRIECALSARALAGPGSRVAVPPLAAVVQPIAFAAATPAAAVAMRRLGAPAATLGLLAAGTAAAALLWLRVLGTDPAVFPGLRGDAPRAAAGETVEAQVSASTGGTEAPVQGPASPRADTPRPTVISAPSAAEETARPTVRDPAPVARLPADERGGGGKHEAGHGGKGKGLGHVKHGDSNGQHSPGHGGSPGASSSAGPSKGAGHGKSHGHGKKH